MEESNNKKDNSKLLIFNKRLISGIILVLALIIVLYFGGNILFLVSLVLSMISLIEIDRVLKQPRTLVVISFVFTVMYYITILQYNSKGILLFLILMMFFILVCYVGAYPKYHIKDISLAIFSVIYTAVMFSFVYLLRVREPDGRYLVWMMFLSSWGCDTFAYVVGMIFGKHKMCIHLSPKKTIEGFIGGVCGSVILCELYAYFFINHFIDNITISLFKTCIAAILGAVVSQVGDLVASAIKRDYNVKDYGDIIPGHGGILDRFDSVIFTAPVFYFIISI